MAAKHHSIHGASPEEENEIKIGYWDHLSPRSLGVRNFLPCGPASAPTPLLSPRPLPRAVLQAMPQRSAAPSTQTDGQQVGDLHTEVARSFL